MRRLSFLLALFSAAAVRCQVDDGTPGWFAFPIPGLDAAGGTAVDLSRLNPERVGAHGRLRVADGHFVDGRGQRLRLIGTNITGDSCFVEPEVAERLALRLRQWGFNCLRLHFMDFSRKGAVWEDPATGAVSEEQLRRLDHLVDACARNGIYVNLNLHVARDYPGQPHPPGTRRFRMGKTLDRWYEPYVRQLEDYARALLDRRNTVTGVRWADDPAIAVIEINNENTLVGEIRRDYRLLPEPWAGAFLAKWNDWLRARHGTTEALRAAWNRDVQPLGEEQTRGTWSIERAGQSESELTIDNGIMRWTASKAGSEFWHLQMQHKGLRLPPGRYTCTFRARSRTANTVSHSLMLDCAPWTTVGLSTTLKLTPEWQTFTLTTPVAAPPVDGPLRLNLSLNNRIGEVEFADYSLRPGGGVGLPAGQSFEAGVAIPGDDVVGEVADDWFAFLLDTEMATTRRIVGFLKEDLGCRAPICDTQAGYGGAGGIRRESELCDYIDMHGYWEHPHYTRDEKGRTTAFRIPNTTQVASPSAGTLGNLACHRVQGFPYAVSEYNIPSPNDHGADLFPMLAAMASLQDWDALYSYTYRDFGKDYESTRLPSYFHLIGRANLLVHVPAAIHLYRLGAMPVASERTILVLPRDRAASLARTHSSLSRLSADLGASPGSAWFRRFEVLVEPTGEPAVRSPLALPEGERSGGPIAWNPGDDRGPWFRLNVPSVRLLVGHLGGRTMTVGDVSFSIAERPWPRGLPAYACVSLTALDGRPVAESQRLLLAASARTENVSMLWNQDRTSLVGKGAWGGDHTLSEAVPLDLSLPGAPFRATALDAEGRPAKPVQVQGRDLRLRAEDQTLWVLIER